MKFGYMPSFETDLLDEIKFAKEHFDFLELTLELDLSKYDNKWISNVKELIGNFEVLGHMHWEIDLGKNEDKEIQKACDSIKIYKKIGVKKVTVHPSFNNSLELQEVRKGNIKSLTKIINFCRKKDIELLVENSFNKPFNKSSEIRKLIKAVPDLKITLDVAHANMNSELNNFLGLKEIEHVHLHDSIMGGKNDHIAFKDDKKLKQILEKINNRGIKTVTFEIFKKISGGKLVSLSYKEKRNIVLSQLNLCKNLLLMACL